MGWFIILLKVVAGIFLLGLVSVAILYYLATQLADKKSRMIDDLAKLPVGSTVAEVIHQAEHLGYRKDGQEFAIPSVIEATGAGDPKDLKNGKLNFGLSLFLFERKGCEFTIEDGKVTAVRVWYLD